MDMVLDGDDVIIISDAPFARKDSSTKESKRKIQDNASVDVVRKTKHNNQQNTHTNTSAAALSKQHKTSSKTPPREAPSGHHTSNVFIPPLDKEEERYMIEGVERFGTNWKRILDTYPFSFYDEGTIIYHWKNHLAKLRKATPPVY